MPAHSEVDYIGVATYPSEVGRFGHTTFTNLRTGREFEYDRRALAAIGGGHSVDGANVVIRAMELNPDVEHRVDVTLAAVELFSAAQNAIPAKGPVLTELTPTPVF